MDIDKALSQHTTALDFRAKRQQVIASNMANVDTPGYKAVDLAFPAQLQRAKQAELPMAGTHSGHINAGNTPSEGALVYRTASQQSIDGNTVSGQAEMAKFTDNALRFEAALKGVSQEMKRIRASLE
jgi:flagellar basal-body rod protein FlgB